MKDEWIDDVLRWSARCLFIFFSSLSCFYRVLPRASLARSTHARLHPCFMRAGASFHPDGSYSVAMHFSVTTNVKGLGLSFILFLCFSHIGFFQIHHEKWCPDKENQAFYTCVRLARFVNKEIRARKSRDCTASCSASAAYPSISIIGEYPEIA